MIGFMFAAERYLSHSQENGSLYSEGYNNVAVIFASIPGFCGLYQESEVLEKGVTCLKALNEIIASFDKVTRRGYCFGTNVVCDLLHLYYSCCLKPSLRELKRSRSSQAHTWPPVGCSQARKTL